MATQTLFGTRLADYLELTKPGITRMVALTGVLPAGTENCRRAQ